MFKRSPRRVFEVIIKVNISDLRNRPGRQRAKKREKRKPPPPPPQKKKKKKKNKREGSGDRGGDVEFRN